MQLGSRRPNGSPQWECTNKACGARISARTGTWFEGCRNRLSLRKAIGQILAWSDKMSSMRFCKKHLGTPVTIYSRKCDPTRRRVDSISRFHPPKTETVSLTLGFQLTNCAQPPPSIPTVSYTHRHCRVVPLSTGIKAKFNLSSAGVQNKARGQPVHFKNACLHARLQWRDNNTGLHACLCGPTARTDKRNDPDNGITPNTGKLKGERRNKILFFRWRRSIVHAVNRLRPIVRDRSEGICTAPQLSPPHKLAQVRHERGLAGTVANLMAVLRLVAEGLNHLRVSFRLFIDEVGFEQ
ncbi:hypothetical protein M513_12740 [Trichuris suis]|uniref:Uncharacterized protein n=1 Tax=Trichuris suis TaxID=68888 RepID=A0A085LN23_9BILA|nr:hypothetical protein M513_12740 [Trichuris suis]